MMNARPDLRRLFHPRHARLTAGLLATLLAGLVAGGCGDGGGGASPDVGGDAAPDTAEDTGTDATEEVPCGEPGQPVCAADACVREGDDLPPVQILSDTMVGCPASVPFASRADVCGEGWSPCSAGQWVARRDGAAPTHHYWTDELLAYDYDGGGFDACTVAGATPDGTCGNDRPMRVCAADPATPPIDADVVDDLGNNCTWVNCSYWYSGVNEFFGGCSDGGGDTAGVLCCQDEPSPCAPERNPCSATEICRTDGDSHSCVAIDPADYTALEGAVCTVASGGSISCGCPPYTEASAGVCVAVEVCSGNATNAASVAPGVASCAGSVTYAERDSLCAPGASACTVAQVVERVPSTFVPAWHQWLNDTLRWAGEASSCSVSLTEGSSCDASPMRICAGSGADTLDNACNWAGCSLDTNPSYAFFGGCEGNPTASTLCCLP